MLSRWIFVLLIHAGIACAEQAAPRFPALPPLTALPMPSNGSAEELLARGQAAFKKGDYIAADANLIHAHKAAGANKKLQADALFWLGETHLKLTRFADSERFYRQAAELWSAEGGAAHLKSLKAQCGLAGCYRVGGYYDAAEKIYKQILADPQAAEDRELTAEALNDLGDTYRNLARYAESETKLKIALELRTALAGPAAVSTAQSTVDLGKLYWQSNQYKLAEEFLEKGFKLQQAALGAEHPDLSETLDYWGCLFAHLRDYKKAEELLDRARALCEKTLGKDHSRYSDLLNDLALVYKNTGRLGKAEEAFKESMRICERVYGTHHFYYGIGLNNLGHFYFRQGKHREAEEQFKRSLEVCRAAFGDGHLHETNALNGLTDVYEAQKRFDEVEELYKKIYAIKEKHLGRSVELAKTLLDWAKFDMDRERTADADERCRQALEILRADTRADPHMRSDILILFARFYMDKERFHDAENYAVEALKLKTAHGEKGDGVMGARCMLAWIYINDGRSAEAQNALEAARKIDPQSRVVSKFAISIARKLMDEREWKRAESVLEETIAPLRKADGDKEYLGRGLLLLGYARLGQERYEEAEAPLRELSSDFKKHAVDKMEHQVQILNALATALDGQDRNQEAQDVRARSKRIQAADEKFEF